MRREWKVMLAVYFAGVTVIINQFKVPPALDILLSDLNINMVQGGWLMSVFGIAGVILSLPAALILDRLGPKVSGISALTCTVIGSVIGGISMNVPMMLAGRIIEGLGAGIIAVVAPSMIAMWFPAAERGLPMGIWTSWRPMGTSLVFNIANPLIPVFGWRSIWWFGALNGLLALIIFALVVSKPAGAPDSAMTTASIKKGLNLSALKTPGIWLLGLGIGGLSFSKAGFTTWAPSYFIQFHNISLGTANFLTSLTSILTIFSTIMTGWLTDKLKRPNLILVISSFLSFILFGCAFLLSSKSWILPWMLMLGFLPGFLATTIVILAPTAVGAPQFAGYAMGMVSMMTNLGSVLGPPAVGGIISSTGGNWSAGAVPLGGGLLVTIIASILFIKTSKGRQVSPGKELYQSDIDVYY